MNLVKVLFSPGFVSTPKNLSATLNEHDVLTGKFEGVVRKLHRQEKSFLRKAGQLLYKNCLYIGEKIFSSGVFIQTTIQKG